MHRTARLLALVCALLLFTLSAACAPAAAPAPTAAPTAEPTAVPTAAPSPTPSPSPTPEPTPEPTPTLPPAAAVADFRFFEPAGFKADETNPLKLNAPDAPADASFIAIGMQPADDAMFAHTAETYEAYLQSTYAASIAGAKVHVEKLEYVELNGFLALRARYTLETDAVNMSMLNYVVRGDSNYELLFSDCTADGRWARAFTDSAKTIRFYAVGETLPETPAETMVLYTADEGLSIVMPEGYARESIEGYNAVLTSDEAAAFFTLEDYPTLLSAGYPKSTTAEEYAALLQSVFELETPFETDEQGNLWTSYVEKVDGAEYYYFVAVKKGEAGFWICNFACPAKKQSKYEPQFRDWAASAIVD